MVELSAKIAAWEPLVDGKPHRMLMLARLMQQDGQGAKALDLCHKALRLAPDDTRLAVMVKAFISESVPDWHFNIIRDEARNAAYDAALRRAVTPDSRVLEIGSGTGILAMMAARAGAKEVVTCEMVPAIADTAAKIVARNGFSDRVRVIVKHSKEVKVEADLGGPSDILVSEIIANNLLGESVLAVHEHAIRNLLKPGAHVIPSRGAVRVALARDDLGSPDLTNIAGFDLSLFDKAFARPARAIPIGDKRLVLLSDAADLFVFDFASAKYWPPAQVSLECVSAGGEVNGVAQWIALTLDSDTHYENRPASGSKSSWSVLFYPFARAVQTAPGQKIRVFGAHDRERLTIWTQK
jgi:type III protein arginine methyltransferase